MWALLVAYLIHAGVAFLQEEGKKGGHRVKKAVAIMDCSDQLGQMLKNLPA